MNLLCVTRFFALFFGYSIMMMVISLHNKNMPWSYCHRLTWPFVNLLPFLWVLILLYLLMLVLPFLIHLFIILLLAAFNIWCLLILTLSMLWILFVNICMHLVIFIGRLLSTSCAILRELCILLFNCITLMSHLLWPTLMLIGLIALILDVPSLVFIHFLAIALFLRHQRNNI